MSRFVFAIILSMCLGFNYGNAYTTNPETPFYGKKKIDFGCSESDAEIYVNGKLLGKGSMELVVPSKDCITVIVRKTGFLSEKIEFCNKKKYAQTTKVLLPGAKTR